MLIINVKKCKHLKNMSINCGGTKIWAWKWESEQKY